MSVRVAGTPLSTASSISGEKQSSTKKLVRMRPFSTTSEKSVIWESGFGRAWAAVLTEAKRKTSNQNAALFIGWFRYPLLISVATEEVSKENSRRFLFRMQQLVRGGCLRKEKIRLGLIGLNRMVSKREQSHAGTLSKEPNAGITNCEVFAISFLENAIITQVSFLERISLTNLWFKECPDL